MRCNAPEVLNVPAFSDHGSRFGTTATPTADETLPDSRIRSVPRLTRHMPQSHRTAEESPSGRKFHTALGHDIDMLATSAAELESAVGKMAADLDDNLADITARVIGLEADLAELDAIENTAVPSLIAASNMHTTNTGKMGTVIRDIVRRLTRLEENSTAVTTLQATVDSHQQALKIVLNRASANTGTTPPVLSANDAAIVASYSDADDTNLRALIEEIVNAHGKRSSNSVREDEGRIKRTRVDIPPSFTHLDAFPDAIHNGTPDASAVSPHPEPHHISAHQIAPDTVVRATSTDG
ncbi:hypothetical protein C8R47DRAFT_1067805 [Mycena vitilis]|nr:hypothetical protein C8R47DRAFT_1067805 [Mycena vitilis]